jgi:DNA-binding MarR family transcriptional regulator
LELVAVGAVAGVLSRSPRPLDEDTKRLLAAILEFSAVTRRDEPPTEPRGGRLGLSQAMSAHGLGTRHASALLSVALWGPMSVTDLARRQHVQVKTASLVAVELEQAGLIERREDGLDRRRTILSIQRGKERVVEEGLRRRAEPLRRALARLTKPQRDGLIAGLEAIAAEMTPPG